MRPTRRYWTTAGFALVLAVGAVGFQRPVLLVGSAGLGAWLLARQVLFVRAATRLDEALTVEQAVTPERVATDEDVHVTLSATLETAVPLAVRVTAEPPIQATGSTAADRTLTLFPGEREATTTFTVSVPVAGTVEFDPPTVTFRDPAGYVQETLARGSTPTLPVEPRAPRTLHIGAGGDEIAAAFGEHRAGRLGPGLDPVELRQYVPGDAANRIDWKATARLNHPYVREYEAETDRTTVLLVDHRAVMQQGPAGETKLDYAREVALAFLNSARELDDPLGCYTVGDEGLTGRIRPEASANQYATIRRHLLALAPTAAADTPAAGQPPVRTPAAARTAASRLAGDTSPFATTLQPYFAEAATYVQRIETKPLFGTARTALTRLRGSLWTVVLTDDTNRAELRETVKLARRGDDNVLVFLTPRVLFEPGGLADLDAAYDRYLDFEQYRLSLVRLDRVAAFEVGPGDRLGALLDAARTDRHRRRAEPR